MKTRRIRWAPPGGGQSGMSLVLVLVAVGISMMIAMALTQVFSNGLKSQLSLEMRGELESLRNTFRRNLDCSVTLDGGELSACESATTHVLALKERGGGTLLAAAADGVKLGRWQVRASCTGSIMHIEAARFVGASTQFAKDPLTGQLQAWRDMFVPETLCGESFGRRSNYVVANLEQGNVGAATSITCDSAGLCDRRTVLGSKSYKAVGQRLLLATNATLGSIGKEQKAAIDVEVYKDSTLVLSAPAVHETSGNDSDVAVFVNSAAQRMLDVIPGQLYELQFVLHSYNTDAIPGHATASSSGPLVYQITDYASQ